MNTNNESFSVSLTNNEKYKARIDNVKVAATVATLAIGVTNIIKTPKDIVNVIATSNDANAIKDVVKSAVVTEKK